MLSEGNGHASTLCPLKLFPIYEGKNDKLTHESRTHVEVIPRVVIHTDIAVVNVLSIGAAWYVVSFTNGASDLVRALLKKLKGKPAELLKCHVSWVGRQS